MTYVDMHSHILPDFDDGSRDIQESLDMLRIAEADGTSVIVATPHAESASADVILAAVEHLNERARHAGLAIRVLPGSEIRLTTDTSSEYRMSELVSINHTPYALIELPFQGTWTAGVYRAMHHLQLAGAWPILAHAERYQAVQHDPRVLLDLVESNVLLQVNAGSLTGEAGAGPRRIAERLARSRMLHILASDAHGPTRRPPELRAAFALLENLAGSEHAAFVQHVAKAVIDGTPVSIAGPDRVGFLKRRRFPWMLWQSMRGE